MAAFLVAGGGIGGLAAARTIARSGHVVTVLEARDAFTELGAGIQLGPNAFHALDRIGVGDEVRAAAVHIDELRLMDGTTDQPVATMPLGDDYRRRFGNPYAVVHRNDLYTPLLSACRADDRITLRTDAAVSRYERKPRGVRVTLASGETLDGDALIGADGINSAVRRQVVGDGPPRVSGHTIYRAVIPMEQVPPELRFNAVTLWAGPRWHFVHYPIAEGRFLNLAATRDDGATEAVSGKPAEPDEVAAQFPGLGDTPRRLLALGDGWRRWVLCDRDPVTRWHDGPVLLVGDAAHPMLQYAAQGAGQALEDAVVLGDLLAASARSFGPPGDLGTPGHSESLGDLGTPGTSNPPGDLGVVFARFCAVRRERTAATTLLARWMGKRLYHASGRVAAHRNRLLGERSAARLHDSAAWLHGHRIEVPA